MGGRWIRDGCMRFGWMTTGGSVSVGFLSYVMVAGLSFERE